jgi:hypothetical protein
MPSHKVKLGRPDRTIAMHQAIVAGPGDLAKFIASDGADFPGHDGTGILVAVLRKLGSAKARVRQLACAIEEGCDPDGLPSSPVTPLFEAAYRCDHQALEVLIDHGAAVDHSVRPGGPRAMEQAVISGQSRLAMVKLLLASGSDPNATPDGRHPLDDEFRELAIHGAPSSEICKLFHVFARAGMRWREPWDEAANVDRLTNVLRTQVQQLCAEGIVARLDEATLPAPNPTHPRNRM